MKPWHKCTRYGHNPQCIVEDCQARKECLAASTGVPIVVDEIPDSGMADTGLRHMYSSGAMRERAIGKGRYDLIAPEFLRRLAVRLEQGTIKYAVRNWEKGFSASETLDSTIRHIYQYLDGEETEDHLAAAAFGLMCVCQFESRNPECLDIPTRPDYYDKENR